MLAMLIFFYNKIDLSLLISMSLVRAHRSPQDIIVYTLSAVGQ